jgi:hypothetical protein
MKMTVNGVSSDIAEGTTVAELVDARAQQQRPRPCCTTATASRSSSRWQEAER